MNQFILVLVVDVLPYDGCLSDFGCGYLLCGLIGWCITISFQSNWGLGAPYVKKKVLYHFYYMMF